MKWFILLMGCLIVSGCEFSISSGSHQCSAEQIELVDKYAGVCSKYGRDESQCFREAKRAVCDRIEQGEEQ